MTFEQQDHKLVRKGTALVSPEKIVAELAEQAKKFSEKRLPILRKALQDI